MHMNKEALNVIKSIGMLILVWLCLTMVTTDYEQSQLENTVVEQSVFDGFEHIGKEALISLIDADKVENIGRDTKAIYITTKDGEEYKTELSNDIAGYATLKGLEVSFMQEVLMPEKESTFTPTQTVNILMSTLIFTVALSHLIRIRRENNKFMGNHKATNNPNEAKAGKGVQKSENIVEIPRVRFNDVYGVDGLKSDIMRVVDYLKNREKYIEIGARAPKGIIMYGPPGTGKTMLAKAIAGEAGVPCFIASGSDFAEMYVGVGAKRVRELYSEARKHAPAIVFIDEVDAIAGKRTDATSTEDVRTLNALLAELDGFKSSDGVVTICATNRLDMLDSAFQRAGRFDLKLAVSMPDKEARFKILSIHAKNKKISKTVKIKELAKKTPGFSGADLEALLNEAAMTAAYGGHREIQMEDIDEAYYKVILQGNKTKKQEREENRKIVAWHEAGHALVTKLLTDDTVSHISIVGSTSGAAGFTLRTPREEALYTRKYIKSLIQIMLAGRAAEELYTGDVELITTGASNDIERATDLASGYIERYGMGKLGLINTTKFKQGDKTNIMSEISDMNNGLYAKVLKLLKETKDCLEEIANTLLENETMNEDELDYIIAKHVDWFREEKEAARKEMELKKSEAEAKKKMEVAVVIAEAVNEEIASEENNEAGIAQRSAM